METVKVFVPGRTPAARGTAAVDDGVAHVGRDQHAEIAGGGMVAEPDSAVAVGVLEGLDVDLMIGGRGRLRDQTERFRVSWKVVLDDGRALPRPSFERNKTGPTLR